MSVVFADEDVTAWLRAKGAHHDVVTWATANAPTWSQFWQACPRGDWLLGVAARCGVNVHDVIDAALACVEVLDPYLPANEPAIDRALALVRRHRAVVDHVDDRAHIGQEIAALQIRCADPSAHAAVMAIAALLLCLDDASAAAVFAASIVQAAVMDAGDCGMMQAARFTEHECARRVRETLTVEALARALAKG